MDPALERAGDADSIEILLDLVRDDAIEDSARKDAVHCLAQSASPAATKGLLAYANEYDWRGWIERASVLEEADWQGWKETSSVVDAVAGALADKGDVRLLRFVVDIMNGLTAHSDEWRPGADGETFYPAYFALSGLVQALAADGPAGREVVSANLDRLPLTIQDTARRVFDKAERRATIDSILARDLSYEEKENYLREALVKLGFLSEREERTSIGFCDCGYPTKFVYEDGSWGPIFGLTRMEMDDRDWQNYFCPRCGALVKGMPSSA